MFCEIMFVLTGRKLISIFHSVGKNRCLQLYLVGHGDDAASEGRCGIPLRKIFRNQFKYDVEEQMYVSKVRFKRFMCDLIIGTTSNG